MTAVLQVARPVYPLVAVATSLLTLLTGLLASDSLTLFSIYLVALCLLYASFGYGMIVVKCLLIFVPLGLITGAISILIKHDWLTGLTAVGRMVLLGLSAITLVTTPPINLTRCMASLRMPRFLTLGMLVTIRFVPILAGEASRIREAMRTRGVNVSWYSLGSCYRAFIIPFMMQLITISDLLAVSIETRGFSMTADRSSVYKTVRFTGRDGVFTSAIVMLSAAAIWVMMAS